MRKHSARKWLHFILDLLPVIFIPVFMVYSHRHTIDSYTVEQEDVEVVNFNQLVPYNNDVLETIHGITIEAVSNGAYHVDGTADDIFAYAIIPNAFSVKKNHLYYLADGITPPSNWSDNGYALRLTAINDFVVWTIDGYASFTPSNDNNDVYLQFLVDTSFSVDFDVIPQLFDMTEMFGSGNEPTLAQFKQWYPNAYYSYTTGRKEAFYTGNTITYNETDILSQLMYSMYNATDNYFNFNKLFNMQSIYDWVQVNFFNGTAPLVIPIVWNVIVYELFMDILFLIYAVFMFIVDFATNMVDSFLHKSSKGGN